MVGVADDHRMLMVQVEDHHLVDRTVIMTTGDLDHLVMTTLMITDTGSHDTTTMIHIEKEGHRHLSTTTIHMQDVRPHQTRAYLHAHRSQTSTPIITAGLHHIETAMIDLPQEGYPLLPKEVHEVHHNAALQKLIPTYRHTRAQILMLGHLEMFCAIRLVHLSLPEDLQYRRAKVQIGQYQEMTEVPQQSMMIGYHMTTRRMVTHI